MPDVSFETWVAGLAADTLTGGEKFPLLDSSTSKHATATLLAAFTVDTLHQAAVITTLADGDELVAFQSDVEKVLTAANFFAWVVDKLEAITTGTTIVSGDKLVFNDGGVLKQIDIDNVKTFLDTSATSLGAQIAALSAATLADSDQYVLAQGSTALKTTFTAIAARVHSQFLAYVTSLAEVATLADADTFYVNDGGVASKVTASTIATYVQAEVGSAILSSAWDTYSALGAAANATDVFLLERSATGRTATGANIASYVVATQNSAADAVAAASGDDFLIFRSGTQMKLDIGFVATHVLNSAWSLSSGSPVVTADKILIGRSGTSYSVTVDQLTTFVLNGVQASVLNLTGLTSATLASGSLFLVGDGATPRKATLAELETKLWADYGTYVGALTAHTSLVDANTFYVLDGSTPKKITAANMAVYMDTELWDKADASPAVQTGDDIWMRRSGVSYKLDVDALGAYVAGITASNLNVGALSSATLSDSDLFLVDEGASNTKVTLADLRTHFWSAFPAYVTGLTASTPAVDADVLYILNTGAPKKLTVGELWDTRYLADAKLIQLDDFAATSDNTDLNATTTAHGLLVKATAPAAGLRNIVAIDNGETAYTNKALFDATVPAALGTAAAGTEMAAARRDHVHTLPKLDDLATPDDNTDLNASTVRHGLLLKAVAPSAGLRSIVAIDNAETVYTNKALFDATVPAALGVAAAGTEMAAARRDHVHTLPKLDDLATPDDNTDLDASSLRHGLLPKLSNNARQFLRGDGTWTVYASLTATAVAATGSLYSDAAALGTTNTTFITCDSTAKGVKLPTGAVGDIMEVINNSSTAAKLYPATGGTLNGLGANAAVVIPASKGVRCFCSAVDTWKVFDMTALATTA